MSINIIDILKPKNNGQFPIVEDIDIKGGFRVVDDIAARDAIYTQNRKIGLIAYTLSPPQLWKLEYGITNSDWVTLKINSNMNFVNSNYTAEAYDDVIFVQSLSPITITLPLADDGKLIIIKDYSNNSSTYNITVDGNGSVIDNLGDYIIDQNGKTIVLMYNSLDANWVLLSNDLPDATVTKKGVIQLAGDLQGTASSPQVKDLTITSEAQGSILYFNGTNWVQLSPGTNGQFLKTIGTGANPLWSNLTLTTAKDYVFGVAGMQSTNSTGLITIGAIVFNKANYPNITSVILNTLIETTNDTGPYSAMLQLFNKTTGTYIQLKTTPSNILITDAITADLVSSDELISILPSGQNVYLVQLKMENSSISEYVTCTMASFEVTYSI